MSSRVRSKHSSLGLFTLAFALALACGSTAPEEEVASRRPTPPTAVRKGETGTAVGERGAPQEAYTRARSGRIYVPIYSHIYVDEGEAEDLAVTISIRNVSTERSLVLNMVAYYDTSGKLIEDYLDTDVVTGPLETIEYFVRVTDRRGGSGANFIVSWRADSALVKPLTEAVMVRTRTGNQAYAFTARGIEIPESAVLPDHHPPPGSYAAPGEGPGDPEGAPAQPAPVPAPTPEAAAAPVE